MSKKVKLGFSCENCGHHEAKWVGRCPVCQEWGTLQEETEPAVEGEDLEGLSSYQQPQRLNEVETGTSVRLHTGFAEFDRILGEGIVAGSVLLLVGDPGIGKSTLSLLTAGNVAHQGKVLYVSGEESAEQTRLRADRLGKFPNDLYVVSETNLELIRSHIREIEPGLVVIDSIQTTFLPKLRTTPGSPSQVKEATLFLVKLAKELRIPFILVGQVTKESELAGPRSLEHLVDTVVYLEGNRNHGLRVARVVKNRYGSTAEVALFEMGAAGLTEVANPSEYLLEDRHKTLPGAVIVATARGTRPLFTEIQALVTDVPEGIPPRQIAIGIDRSRLLLVSAVIQRWLGERLMHKNIFVSTAGGIESDDPGLDLGIAAALLTSVKGIGVPPDRFFLGELTLSGEVRPIPEWARLLSEGERLGFTECIVAKRSLQTKERSSGMKLHGLEHVRDLPALLKPLGVEK